VATAASQECTTDFNHGDRKELPSAHTQNWLCFILIKLNQVPSLNERQIKAGIPPKHGLHRDHHRPLQKPPTSSNVPVQMRAKGPVLLCAGTWLWHKKFLQRRQYVHQQQNKPSPMKREPLTTAEEITEGQMSITNKPTCNENAMILAFFIQNKAADMAL